MEAPPPKNMTAVISLEPSASNTDLCYPPKSDGWGLPITNLSAALDRDLRRQDRLVLWGSEITQSGSLSSLERSGAKSKSDVTAPERQTKVPVGGGGQFSLHVFDVTVGTAVNDI